MRITDQERADKLRLLATNALRKNQQRIYQMPWEQVVYDGLENSSEMAYMAAATPAFVLRLLKRAERPK